MKILKKIRLYINKVGSRRRNKKIINKDITIISNNCFSGIVYQHYNLEFCSPTIGCYFSPKDFIKFCSDLHYYLSLPLCFITFDESHNQKIIMNRNTIIGLLGDVEIIFLHYTTEEEAFSKWMRRTKKVNYKRIIYKFNDQNGCCLEDLKAFDKLNVRNKVIFSSKKNDDIKSLVWIKKYRNFVSVKEDYYSCYKYYDLIALFNSLEE